MLLTVNQAAEQMNVPATALRREAEKHGLLVRFGRSVRIDPETIPELIERCRNAPKAHASTTTRPRASMSYETLADLRNQQAQETAQRLKKPSPSTSQSATGHLVRLARKDS